MFAMPMCRAYISLLQLAEPENLNLTIRSSTSDKPYHRATISPPSTMFTTRALTSALRAGAPRAPIAVRGYAAAAAPSGAATRPPVALFGIDGTYASALVRLRTPNWGPSAGWKMAG